MGCCNVRTLSFISASLQLALWVVVLLVSAIFGIAVNSTEIMESDKSGLVGYVTAFVVIIGTILGVLSIAFVVTLIVGIEQNRVMLVKIYIWAKYVTLTLAGILIIVGLVSELMDETLIADVLLNLFEQLLYLGLDILLFVPILMLYRRMCSVAVQPTSSYQQAPQSTYVA